MGCRSTARSGVSKGRRGIHECNSGGSKAPRYKRRYRQYARFYLSSIVPSDRKRLGLAIPSHRGVEKSLHHALYLTFDQEKSRVRKEHGPENFAVPRHFAMHRLE